MEHVAWARDLARGLLADALPRRWSHVQGVARTAASIGHIVGGDAELLACAAWLHDIGYAPELVVAGFHPLDGARHLRDVVGADDQLCRLVANHSCAIIEAGRRGLADQLRDEFPSLDGALADALTYCDMTTSPDGEPVAVADRLAEILDRYGPDTIVGASISEAYPQIIRTADVVSARVREDGR